MDELALLVDLHKGNPRQGPGSEAATKLALQLAGVSKKSGLKVADIGCGAGASTLVLAQELDAEITAVDLFPEFLQSLAARAKAAGVSERIHTLSASMEDLPFAENSFDVIWSEGAIYCMGFEKGISYFHRFLKPGGIVAVSELTWLTAERPAELTAHWEREYPEVNVASAKMAQLEAHGYVCLGYFPLPPDCWLDNYYAPLQACHAPFLERHSTEGAQQVVTADHQERALYEQYQDFYSYGFYIAQKRGE